jgi:hypothetical protein
MTDPVAPPLDFSHVRIATPLVALADVKAHLYVTDTAHDAEVAAKYDAAQERVLAHLAAAADPAWTDLTVPRAVRSSILMLTAALYEIRGGEDPDENFLKTWAAIALLLSSYRDPALA